MILNDVIFLSSFFFAFEKFLMNDTFIRIRVFHFLIINCYRCFVILEFINRYSFFLNVIIYLIDGFIIV